MFFCVSSLEYASALVRSQPSTELSTRSLRDHESSFGEPDPHAVILML